METHVSATGTLAPPVAVPPSAREEPLYEIVNGVKVELPSTGAFASWVTLQFAFLLQTFVGQRALGTIVMETLFILDAVRDTRCRPDIAFVSAQKWSPDRPPPETGDWEVIPDVAVEVVSPNDLAKDVLSKMREYFRLGVQQVWIVYPLDQELYVYDSPTTPRVFSATDELDGGTLLPGLHLPVASFFQRQPQAAPAR
jgi:Uma2 family endonuclease